MSNTDRFWNYVDPNEIKRWIVVRGQYEGYHRYENAPDEVAFLRSLHRHIFKWEATIEVFHDDRELEFFMVKTNIERNILPYNIKGDLGSCEMQAEFLLSGLVNSYGLKRRYQVRVSEDGENDGVVQLQPNSSLTRRASGVR